MAYEDLTYEVLLDRMLLRVKESYPDLDTREGSILYNALAPAAVELAIAYTELDNLLSESFVATASREYLFMACEQMGLDTQQFEATAGTHKAEFDVEVEIGSRWNLGLHNYFVLEQLESDNEYYAYSLVCETFGTEPNTLTGSLTAITNIPNDLTYAELVGCIEEGSNEVSDEDIRAAYFDFINATATDGNIGQYERWCINFDGVGNYKILPLWNGANTVKISILNEENDIANEALVNKFQEYLDPNTTGMGDGVAPIGAFVTVTTATKVPIDISCNVKLINPNGATPDFNTALNDYFKSICYEKTSIPYMTIGSTILNVDGVESISNLLINGGTADITLGVEEIPSLGTTSWTVN